MAPSTPSLPASAKPVDAVPLRYGALVYPGFQALDLFGPLDALNTLAWYYPLDLVILAETLDPVSTIPPGKAEDGRTPTFGQSIIPTHTFANAPPIDVLLVPGGVGNRIPENIAIAISFIAKVYPTLKYLITVCTGSVLVSQAGVLDGRRATSNKYVFSETQIRPQVKWVPHARWVVDGNIWTSFGVSAGLDVIFSFMAETYGAEVADMISDILEYERHKDADWDPYAEKFGL